MRRVRSVPIAPVASDARPVAHSDRKIRTIRCLRARGRELQVSYLLAGSVRKAANQVRVSVQLIDATTGFQVWADDFTGELKDVFALQEQTAPKIGGGRSCPCGKAPIPTFPS